MLLNAITKQMEKWMWLKVKRFQAYLAVKIITTWVSRCFGMIGREWSTMIDKKYLLDYYADLSKYTMVMRACWSTC